MIFDLGYAMLDARLEESAGIRPPDWAHLNDCSDRESLRRLSRLSIDRAALYCSPMPDVIVQEGQDNGTVLRSVWHSRTPRRNAGIAAASILTAETAHGLGDYRDACRLCVYAVVSWEIRNLDWLYARYPVTWDQYVKSLLESEVLIQAAELQGVEEMVDASRLRRRRANVDIH